MHDIALLLVKFGKLLIIVFPILKWYYRVQKVRFSLNPLFELRNSEKFFDPPEINMYNIVLMLVMFGTFLIIVFPISKSYHLVQDGRFSRKPNVKTKKFASLNHVIGL